MEKRSEGFDQTVTVPPRRVLHVTYGLDFGGVETHLRLIAEAPGKRQQHLFCAIAGGGAALDAIVRCGVTAHVLHVDPWRRPMKTVLALWQLMRRTSPDLVHCHGSEANIFGLAAAFLSRIPVRIGEEIGMPQHSAKAKLAMRAIYSTATVVIAVAQAVADRLVATREVPRRKIICLHNPVDLPTARARIRKEGEGLRIAYVGRLDPIKNPLALIEAVAILADRGIDCQLIMAGDGPQRLLVEQAVIDQGVATRVQLLGYVSEPGPVLASCHIFVQPSLSEGLSLALVEAMGCGLAVISTAVGGSVEVVEDGTTGWLLKSSKAPAIADAIARAASLPKAELAAMGDRGRLRAQDFDIGLYVQRLEALYDLLFSTGAGR